ncbi:hypothetical protein BJ165DRAFT_1503656 [Panaeolus papilionaceus]|nr:hypothetical protein BJ165DRAFT_1503656 [Panaeolus papilionaceus]
MKWNGWFCCPMYYIFHVVIAPSVILLVHLELLCFSFPAPCDHPNENAGMRLCFVYSYSPFLTCWRKQQLCMGNAAPGTYECEMDQPRTLK